MKKISYNKDTKSFSVETKEFGLFNKKKPDYQKVANKSGDKVAQLDKKIEDKQAEIDKLKKKIGSLTDDLSKLKSDRKKAYDDFQEKSKFANNRK